MKRSYLILVLCACQCIDPYTPELEPSSDSVLVIDGFLEPNQTSIVRLSRSTSLNSTDAPPPEVGASVWIEDINNQTIFFQEVGNGEYSLLPQTLPEESYQLHVITSENKHYASAFETVKQVPEIDSLWWRQSSANGIQLFVTTHNDEESEGYYRWRYEETWSYTSAYQSTYVYDPVRQFPVVRTDDIYNCWRNLSSTNIYTYSTQGLEKNLVPAFNLTSIANNSERIRYRYSILVKQYPLSKEGFFYWQQLKKNTEDLGTLFGPLPSQIRGNFKCLTNPEEVVLGYFDAGYTTSKRIFITFQELQGPTSYNTPYSTCELNQILFSDPNLNNILNGSYLIIFGIPNPGGPGIIGFTYSSPFCVDCTLSGGSTTKPDFWP
jgi:hypothetical protein